MANSSSLLLQQQQQLPFVVQKGSSSALPVRHGPRADILTWTKKRLFFCSLAPRLPPQCPPLCPFPLPPLRVASRFALQRDASSDGAFCCTHDRTRATMNDLTSNGVFCAPLSTIRFASLVPRDCLCRVHADRSPAIRERIPLMYRLARMYTVNGVRYLLTGSL